MLTAKRYWQLDATIPAWSSEVAAHEGRGAFLAVEYAGINRLCFTSREADNFYFRFTFNIGGLALAYWIGKLFFMTYNLVPYR
jgi:hypothetical protein